MENTSKLSDNYFYKYIKYKKKYLRKVHQLAGGSGKFDISISGLTTPNNKFKNARILHHEGKYIISISLDVPILGIGGLTYPLELQNGKVYSIGVSNKKEVIVFKYKDDKKIKTIQFIVNNHLRKRFTLIKGKARLTIM
jgi:hypothetical protein